MRLKSIQMKNIRSYIDEKIEFPEGSTLLSGDIGCGKSTILMAMEFALFGLLRGGTSGTDILRHGASSGSVRLNFELDGNDILVERTLKRSKNVMQDSGRILTNGAGEERVPTEIKSAVLEMFGYPKDMLKKNTPLFRYTVYTPQEDMKSIMFSEQERLSTLRKVFGIDKYGMIKSNAAIFTAELRSMKREIEASISAMDFDTQHIDILTKEKSSVSTALNSEASALLIIKEEFGLKKTEMLEVKRKFESANSARLELAGKRAEIAAKEDRLRRLRIEIGEHDAKISEYEKSLTEAVDPYIIRQQLSDTQKKHHVSLSSKAKLELEISKLQSILSKGMCEVCGQSVHNPDEFMGHIDRHTSSLNNIISEIGEFEKVTEDLKSLLETAEKLAYNKRLLDAERATKEKKEDEARQIKNSIHAAEGGIEKLHTAAAGYEELRSIISSIEDEFSRIMEKKSSIEKNIAKYEQRLHDIEQRLADISRKMKLKEELKDKSAKISQILSWFTSFITLMENIEKHTMFTIQMEFDSYFQKWFSVLMGDTLSVRIDEKFSPVIEQNSFETDYNNLSGGEKTSVALAYRLALNKVVNKMIDTIKTKDLLILDEPTDGFSSEQLDRIRDVINELNLRQIIIVSHEPKIDTYVDNVIRIYKEGHISSVAY
ncbi:AAA family ATPase [Candidatus Woesearchaeota archaeon]|nr:AAA family ATPase [Candidatus Woesearchaeota archaeon]